MMKPRLAWVVVLTACFFVLSSCVGLPGANRGSPDLKASVNHIVIMLQENRSFDQYFGKLNDYRAAHGYPGTVDGIPAGGFANISPNGQFISSYHSGSVCMENMSPDWFESRKNINLQNPADISTPKMDGFVANAAGLADFSDFLDKAGRRAMAYYTDQELNYYYFMASNFAMSDRFFSPIPATTTNNRLYMFSATSQGYVHVPTARLDTKTIWQLLDEHNVSWKIYITDPGLICPDFTPHCLTLSTYLQFFTYSDATGASHLAPLSQYFTDVANGTLPSVAFIESGYFSGRDEHPSGKDLSTNPPVQEVVNIQKGAAFSAEVINALMNSPSWKDSVFFWTFDEAGGAFDHVPPMSAVLPDGIAPVDFIPGKDTLAGGTFNISGFRVPNMVVSPFARRNFVSHTPMDATAILKFIELRFDLPSLTARDSAQPDMSEFFDFSGKPWATPPAPPAQRQDAACDFNLE